MLGFDSGQLPSVLAASTGSVALATAAVTFGIAVTWLCISVKRTCRAAREHCRHLEEQVREHGLRLKSLETRIAAPKASASTPRLEQACERLIAELGIKAPRGPDRYALIVRKLIENGRAHRRRMEGLLGRLQEMQQSTAARQVQIEKRANELEPLIARVTKTAQRLADAEQCADRTKGAMETLDECLNAQLARREDIVERIDRQIGTRNIQLVTDILRAEGMHLQLSTALGDVDHVVRNLGRLASEADTADAATSDPLAEPTAPTLPSD
ncbi:MAG: hypothetical protein ACE5F9_03815 [Phycisphaerae bacterium]